MTRTSEVETEILKKMTKKLTAQVFYVNISEQGQNTIDKLNEEKDVIGKRRWIAKNMRVKDMKLLISEREGEMFQNDLEKLITAI
jgi:hypothetical protein